MARGGDKRTGELFSYVDLEKRVRSDHRGSHTVIGCSFAA